MKRMGLGSAPNANARGDEDDDAPRVIFCVECRMQNPLAPFGVFFFFVIYFFENHFSTSTPVTVRNV